MGSCMIIRLIKDLIHRKKTVCRCFSCSRVLARFTPESYEGICPSCEMDNFHEEMAMLNARHEYSVENWL